MSSAAAAGTPNQPGPLHALLADAAHCATAAGLHYAEHTDPGIARHRCGRGFRYVAADGGAVDGGTRERIAALAIPPAWREVWICVDADAHLQAVGVDDRGRTQYLYHARWREFRDLINFYRLTEVGRALPPVRADVEGQLRRRTLDRPRVISAMLRLADRLGLRVGNEIYAEENDTVGLCTLRHRHVRVAGARISLSFKAKSGRRVAYQTEEAAVARVLRGLSGSPSARLFRADGVITAEDVNERLCALSGEVMTAKDFRTWRGTVTAFGYLREHRSSPDREATALAAIDAAADALGNTRAVARAHYVHPHVVETYLDGTFTDRLTGLRPVRAAGLSRGEGLLLRYLDELLREYSPLR